MLVGFLLPESALSADGARVRELVLEMLGCRLGDNSAKEAPALFSLAPEAELSRARRIADSNPD